MTIEVDVWKYNEKTNKLFSSSVSLQVNANIKDDVKNIFDTIYNSDEKFPIKSVGGYSWRGMAGNSSSRSHHSYGTAIDINWEENYMTKGSKIIAGELYEPRSNRYSMPDDGIVVTTFKEHGWVWGGDWKNTKDYMHFSFLGK